MSDAERGGRGHDTAAWRAAGRLSGALESENFAGWDPYDALASPLLRRCARTPLLRRLAIQSLKWSPINPRPVLGVPKQQHTKALALCASAYARLAWLDEGARYGELARTLGQRLAERVIDRPDGGAGWGYDFDVQTRWGYYRRGQPNAVATAFAAHALLDVGSRGEDPSLEELPRRAAAFMCSELLEEEPGGSFFRYFPGADTAIHNASLLLASVIARLDGSEHYAAAERAVHFSLERQRADGSWPYGEHPGLGWVDGFHTAYVLDSLATWHRRTGGAEIGEAITRGLRLYLDRLIEPTGAPRATLDSLYPIDIHSASTAVTTLSGLQGYDDRALQTAERVLEWTLRNMTRRDGRFAFRRHRPLRNSVPYVRWSDGHMLLALANYLTARRRAESGDEWGGSVAIA
jgi:hypothetical protein